VEQGAAMTLWQQARGAFIDGIAWDETGDDRS
jgi:hypothetical protein